MRRSIAVTHRGKEILAQVLVGLILIGAMALAGCDAPTGKRTARGSRDAAAVVAARVESPTPATIPVADATPPPPRVVSFDEAEAAYRDRDYRGATDFFSSYVETKPDNPWGHYMLGLSAWKTGDLTRAEEAFERSLSLDPKHVKSYLNLARVLLEADRPSDALTRVDSALALDSLSNVAYRLRGLALDGLDRAEEAIDAYREAISLDENDVWSMNDLGVLYLHLGWPNDALYPLARAVSIDTTSAVFFNNLGMALEQTGRWAKAADVYRLAVAADSTHTRAVANLARVDGRPDDPYVEPVDLALVAQEFRDRIAGWRRTDVSVRQP